MEGNLPAVIIFLFSIHFCGSLQHYFDLSPVSALETETMAMIALIPAHLPIAVLPVSPSFETAGTTVRQFPMPGSKKYHLARDFFPRCVLVTFSLTCVFPLEY